MVLGLDGAKAGWPVVVLDEGHFAGASLVKTFADALARWPDANAIAVDMPIGCPAAADYPRKADTAARHYLGARRSSVFFTPPRELLEEGDYARANARMKELTGKGLSRQSFALFDKIREVEAHRTEHTYEVHPEVSFQAAAGAPLRYPKRAWNGHAERIAILRSLGIELPGEIPDLGNVAADDLIDAAICAWTAQCIAIDEAAKLPRALSKGAGAIWMPAAH